MHALPGLAPAVTSRRPPRSPPPAPSPPPQDATSPEGPSQYSLELLHGSSSPQPVTAVAGCATTPVADDCQADGPAPASIQLRCLNGDRPCRVRVASYVSPCPGGPQPLALAAGEQAGTCPPPAQPGGLPAPPPLFPDGSSGGVSTTTWVIVGASAGAALLLGKQFKPAGMPVRLPQLVPTGLSAAQALGPSCAACAEDPPLPHALLPPVKQSSRSGA